MAGMFFVLVLCNLAGKVSSDLISVTNYTLKLKDSDNQSCLSGRTLLVSNDTLTDDIPVCNTIPEDELSTICEKVQCPGTKGVITSQNGASTIPLVLGEESTLHFYTEDSCQVNILCFDPDSQCYLPTLENGRYDGFDNPIYSSEVLEMNERVKINCNENYTWVVADSVICVKLSSGDSVLSSTPSCVPLSADNLMSFTVNVTTDADITRLTGVVAVYLNPEESDSILSQTDKLSQYCSDGYCHIPTYAFNQSPDNSEEGGADNFALLAGEHSDCFQIAILSLFLQGIQTIDKTDIFESYDTRPSGNKVKRALVDNSLEIKIAKLELGYDPVEKTSSNIRVEFYIFQYGSVLTPDIITRILHQVPILKYDVVLESYCRLQKCPSDSSYSDCDNIPVMEFHSLPKPLLPCSYQGVKLSYGEAIKPDCGVNQYSNETQATLCLYGNKYSPPALPTCAMCGGLVIGGSLYGPVRSDGLNARGANCVWDISHDNDVIGIFYQNVKSERSCLNSVSYLKITEYDSDGKPLEKQQDICFGMVMYLTSRIKIEFVSNPESDVSLGFTFEFEPNLPALPWYRRYMPILIAAPIVVIFLLSLVFLGLYCDHRNRSKVKQLVTPVDHHGDHTSNGTWRPNTSLKDGGRETETVDNALTPQPRVHNAVPKSSNRSEKKRARAQVDTAAGQKHTQGTEIGNPAQSYGSWVMSSNGGDPSSTAVDGASVPVRTSGGEVSTTTLLVPADTQSAADTVTTRPTRRKKRRRKKRPVSDVRPLPELADKVDNAGPGEGAGVPGAAVRRGLPPLEGGSSAGVESSRALPPITTSKDEYLVPFVSNDLGVD